MNYLTITTVVSLVISVTGFAFYRKTQARTRREQEKFYETFMQERKRRAY